MLSEGFDVRLVEGFPSRFTNETGVVSYEFGITAQKFIRKGRRVE